MARFLLIAALMVSIGAHWGVLQIAAWATMVKDYSAEKGLWVGIKDTFDGEHPCQMCEKISKGKESESGQQKVPASKGYQAGFSMWLSEVPTVTVPLRAATDGHAVRHGDAASVFFYAWGSEPPVPPPRLAA